MFSAGFRPSDVILTRAGNGLWGYSSGQFPGRADVDYLIDIHGTLIRAALPSHECVSKDLKNVFKEGEKCSRLNSLPYSGRCIMLIF